MNASINNKLMSNDSLFDPTQQFMSVSIDAASRTDNQSKQENQNKTTDQQASPPKLPLL